MAEKNDLFGELEELSSGFYKQWEQSMTGWWDEVLESPPFLQAMGKNLEGMARGRGAYEEAVDDTLQKMHLPTRGDLTRVLRVASLLEDKLLSMEDTLLKLGDQLVAAEKDAVQARVEAAEARLEAREQLAAMSDRLAGLEARLAAPTKKKKPAAKRATKGS